MTRMPKSVRELVYSAEQRSINNEMAKVDKYRSSDGYIWDVLNDGDTAVGFNVCTRCGRVLPLSRFPYLSAGKVGSICKMCTAETRKATRKQTEMAKRQQKPEENDAVRKLIEQAEKATRRFKELAQKTNDSVICDVAKWLLL